MVAVTIP